MTQAPHLITVACANHSVSFELSDMDLRIEAAMVQILQSAVVVLMDAVRAETHISAA